MKGWKFFVEGKCPSRSNMDRDCELLELVRCGEMRGAVRIYDWDEPAVTVGHHQKNFTFFDRKLSLPVIPRPTGGGAVLHGDDITFCICTPHIAPFSPNINESYTFVSGIFASALKKCGLDVNLDGEKSLFSPVCFSRSTPVEIMSAGSKIMGLALLRTAGYLLFQGVLPLRVDKELTGRVFGPEQKKKARGISEIMPDFCTDQFVEYLAEGFSRLVKIPLSVERSKDDKQYHQGYQGKIYAR